MSFAFTPPLPAAVPVAGTDMQFPVNRVYCVGRNYVEHAKEMGFTGREPPFFFLKPADALVVVPEGVVGEIPYPPGTSNLHHEIELVVAIGEGGRNIAAADAGRHIFGYAVGLDMTRRDLQGEAKKLGRPWEIGKAFDRSAPIGPIRRAAEVPGAAGGQPMAGGEISLHVNGTPRQSSDVSKLIWNIAETIEHLSKYWELKPGDLVFTGTPEGVAAVQAGDLMEGRVAGVGELKVRVA
ncbi:MAG: fumarylacetoacetate hydrolase family protein [Limnobacter sp.]|nr:fumarylacetoacetate hydrolase family protein [Limnobacter sp.]